MTAETEQAAGELPDIIHDIALLITDLQVPRSIGILRHAAYPWDAVIARLGLFGWVDAQQVEARLREKITCTS